MIICTGVNGRPTQEQSAGWEGGDVATRRTYAPEQTETRTPQDRGGYAPKPPLHNAGDVVRALVPRIPSPTPLIVLHDVAVVASRT